MTCNINDRVKTILEQTHLMSLSTIDGQGPWAADVIFVFDEELNLYWISDPDARHSRAVRENHKAAAAITFSIRSKEPNLGLQMEGMAEQLEGVQFELLIKHLAKRGYKMPKLDQAKKLLDGDVWYRLKPTRMFLIDEENFGFERQEVPIQPL